MLKAKSKFNPEIIKNKKIRFFVFVQQFSWYQQLLTHLKIYINTYFELIFFLSSLSIDIFDFLHGN